MPLRTYPPKATKEQKAEVISYNIAKLEREHPEWSQDKCVAAGIAAARGNKK